MRFAQTRRHGGAYRGRAPPSDCLCPPKRKLCPPKRGLCPEEINRLGASGAQIEVQISVFCGLTPDLSAVYGRAELSADYCVSNTATRVRLRLQAACFDIYAGGWRFEERELTSQSPSPLRSY